MIRLAVGGADSMWNVVASRLRGATIETADNASRNLASLPECDAVLFIEPDDLNAGLIEQSLRAGKHVLLTVSAKLTRDLLETLSAVARRGGAQVAVMNPDHFLPSRRLIRQQLDAGKLGQPGLIRLHRWQPATIEKVDSPGGMPTPLMRDVELALSLMGASPNLVYAVACQANDDESTTGQSTQVHLGFPGGGMALIDFANRMPPGDDYVSLTVIGSGGAAYADDQQNMQLVYRGGHPQSLRVEEKGLQLAAMVQDFVDGLIANRDFSASVAAWIGVLKVSDAGRESIAARRAVQLEM